jgi:hypothetical protein
MRSAPYLIVACVALGAVPRATAQTSMPLSAEAGLGIAMRSDPRAGASSTNGIQAQFRVGTGLNRYLRLVGEASFTRFPDEDLIFASVCPVGVPCLPTRQGASATGLGMVSVAAGLQPRVAVGPLQLRLTTTAGGYWLYHRASGLPGLAPGVRAGLGLGFPVGVHSYVVLQASVLRLLGSAIHDANSRQLGIGFAFN